MLSEVIKATVYLLPYFVTSKNVMKIRIETLKRIRAESMESCSLWEPMEDLV